MSNTERKKILNYRTDKGIAPTPDNIDHGEIAIGYKKDNEAIYIKNTANEIVDFTPISIVNITYNELKNLRDNSKLKPSQYYRITDFVTTVANDDEARSAGHPFDIIVMASKENKLQEECYAIQHESDTYFANCNLAAWKIWYCLDNDNTKYSWADATNGKGVIYRMIDEFGNDCPYDFKNIQFKRYWANGTNVNGATILQGYFAHDGNQDNFSEGVDTARIAWCYTFNFVNNSEDGSEGDYSSVYDASLNLASSGTLCADNIIRQTRSGIAIFLNNIVFLNTSNYRCSNNSFGDDCSYNSFGNNCYNNIFGGGCYYNSFGNDCYNNSFGNNCTSNSFGNGCNNNSFGNSCSNNSFGNNCNSNIFGGECFNNSFGNNCTNNTFGNYFQHNALGNDIQYIEIPTEKIYHTQILNGTQGTQNNKLTIAFTPETTYSQFAGFKSDGVLETWVEADAPHDVVDGGSY